ncbi:hypothetical protein VP01_265g5 [Puccinia sorghi]|uniref:Uncharacterized protein n=1 Tax=Puccinia sorghi TaxID=27349 RepID=A0A0L6V3Z5_9BASI|nr:hypothetical protein VP01_265g5 [Puccinia sorghi]
MSILLGRLLQASQISRKRCCPAFSALGSETFANESVPIEILERGTPASGLCVLVQDFLHLREVFPEPAGLIKPPVGHKCIFLEGKILRYLGISILYNPLMMRLCCISIFFIQISFVSQLSTLSGLLIHLGLVVVVVSCGFSHTLLVSSKGSFLFPFLPSLFFCVIVILKFRFRFLLSLNLKPYQVCSFISVLSSCVVLHTHLWFLPKKSSAPLVSIEEPQPGYNKDSTHWEIHRSGQPSAVGTFAVTHVQTVEIIVVQLFCILGFPTGGLSPASTPLYISQLAIYILNLDHYNSPVGINHILVGNPLTRLALWRRGNYPKLGCRQRQHCFPRRSRAVKIMRRKIIIRTCSCPTMKQEEEFICNC